MNPLDLRLQEIARINFVVLLKDARGKLQLLDDPGMGKPWSTKNKRMADHVAHENGGMAASWEDAFNLLKKDYPNFEHTLIERIKQQANIPGKTVTTAQVDAGLKQLFPGWSKDKK